MATASSTLVPRQLQHQQHQQQHNYRPADHRYQSSARRTKRALNVKPDESFVGGAGTPLGTIKAPPSATSTTTLLYNPPASAPSVYQTPFKFLPKSDPRRRANLTNLFKSVSSQGPSEQSSSSLAALTSPIIPHKSYAPPPKQYHLTEEDVAEMRRLRTLDPLEWSVQRLARKFQCSPIFVMIVVRSSSEHQARRQEQLAAVRQRWGPIRTKARADRAKRLELLHNGQL